MSSHTRHRIAKRVKTCVKSQLQLASAGLTSDSARCINARTGASERNGKNVITLTGEVSVGLGGMRSGERLQTTFPKYLACCTPLGDLYFFKCKYYVLNINALGVTLSKRPCTLSVVANHQYFPARPALFKLLKSVWYWILMRDPPILTTDFTYLIASAIKLHWKSRYIDLNRFNRTFTASVP